jgi:hypothetical protein
MSSIQAAWSAARAVSWPASAVSSQAARSRAVPVRPASASQAARLARQAAALSSAPAAVQEQFPAREYFPEEARP